MFCNKCGTQFEEGTAVCAQCGNDLNAAVAKKEAAVAPAPTPVAPTPVAPTKALAVKDNKKLLLMIIAAVVVVALIVVGAIFIPKAVKANKAAKLEESLVGESFTYIDSATFSYTRTEITFEEDGCNVNTYYSALDHTSDYKWDYMIKYVSDDEIILCIGSEIGDKFNTFYEYSVNVNSDGDAVRSFSEIDNEDALYE